jgi:HTH-type transcriptional regulator / antitoxin HigA
MSNSTFDPDYAVPPGATLLETINSLGLTQKELAQRMGRPLKTINEIVKGLCAITAETALQLEKVTGIPASFWNSMEANYRERLARIQEFAQIEAQFDWLKCFSYPKMVALQLVEATSDKAERVNNLLSFFGVASSEQWQSTYGTLEGAAREAKWESHLGDLSVWLRAGELKARNCNCNDYDAKRFRSALTEIRKLTQQAPQEAWPTACKLCAEAGVAVVLVPELPKTHVHGFTRWLTPSKALIQLSLRHKTDDILWFTFFHEAAHILLHGKKDIFLEARGIDSVKETEANEWAANNLIAPKHWEQFVHTYDFSIKAVETFAKTEQINPSIIVGRLQREGLVGYQSPLRNLKHRIEIAWAGL